ncbi:MAG: GGDEF domain-containing protein [Bacilli bacterium]|jgi:diguanylate cyclase (GGDEF)-like protein
MTEKMKLFLEPRQLSQLLKKHKVSIKEYNAKVVPEALWIASVITLIPSIISLFRPNMYVAFPAYLAACLSSVLLLVIFSVLKRVKYALIGAYLLVLIAFSLVFYLGIFIYPEYPGGTILVFFALISLLFIDNPFRFNLLITAFYVIYTVFSYIYKGAILGGVDLLNGFIALALGILFGRLFLRSRLETFEIRYQLILEKETDVLTGLNNRRKLFETIHQFEDGTTKCPSALMMIDIDNFKNYNDQHGHRVGDEYLKSFGNFLANYQNKYPIYFYRYGGEEFVALVYDTNKEEAFEIAELIRLETMTIPVDQDPITISIGLVNCDEHVRGQHETIISQADVALYHAKAEGRNRVTLWDEELDHDIRAG